MPLVKNKIKTSPKDFFLHLLNIVMLYISAAGFGRILFVMINYYWPDPLEFYGFNDFNSIRWAIASIIVAWPVYLIGARSLNRDYQKNPEKKNLRVKLWLEYFTMFGAAVIILVTLMTVIYKFLNGEITPRFILKTLTMLYIAGVIFYYYFSTVKIGFEKSRSRIKVLVILVSLTILAAIILGFMTVGSPSTERLRRFDDKRLSDLQSVQAEVINFWQRTRRLPADLNELGQAAFWRLPVDPQTYQPYDYQIIDDLSFELCAVFATDKQAGSEISERVAPVPGLIGGGQRQNIYEQDYQAGRNCFSFMIKPELYPELK
ncbi:MAG TPA: DUF5671 domain-containing protein [Patescibacteria group bacterium]